MSAFFQETTIRPDERTTRNKNHLAVSQSVRLTVFFLALLFLATLTGCSSCRQNLFGKRQVTPRAMRDVPAQRLSFRLEPDVQTPQGLPAFARNDKVEPVEKDFSSNRQVDALHTTILSPDKLQTLAVYISPDSMESEYQIALYSSSGALIRNITTPDFAVVAPETISWSPDGNRFAFIAKKSAIATKTPNDMPTETSPPPITEGSPATSPLPTPIGPIVAPLDNEQIFTCKSDGTDLKLLTVLRANLIYFYFAWSPDSTKFVALAARRDEWESRPVDLAPAGRPRIIDLQGNERLLDEKLTDVLPVWSPDSSKVATAYGTDVRIYDVGTDAPSQAAAVLRDQLLVASVAYEDAVAKKNQTTTPTPQSSPTPNAPPSPDDHPSFNPVVRLFWLEPKLLYLQTGYVRFYDSGADSTWLRWHLLHLSPQSAALE